MAKDRRDRTPPPPTAREVRDFLERDPPAAQRAEMSLIGSLLLDPSRVPEVAASIPGGDAFSNARHAIAYDAIVKLFAATGTVDLVQLVERLESDDMLADTGGADYLVSLAESVPSAVNAARYAALVREKFQLRRLIDAAGQILHDAYTSSGAEGEAVREVLDRAEQSIFKVAEDVASADSEDLRTLLERQIDMLASNEGRALTGLDTGFFDLNELTSGFQPGELIIVAGRPSMGKTAFALNVAEHMAASRVTGPTAVAVFSMEMSRMSVASRLLCARSGVDSHRLRKNMLGKADFDRLLSAADELNSVELHIDDTPGLTPMLLRAKARRMAQQHKIGAIFVDYLQLMSSPSSSRDGRQQEVSEISRSIKALARDLNVPIICLAQLNRGAEQREGHRPRMADLRESGSIEQDADVVILLHREEYYHTQDPNWAMENPEKDGLAEIIIAKQRNGPTGVVEVSWDSRATRFLNRAHQRPNAPQMGVAAPEPKPQTPAPASENDVEDIPF